MVSRDSMTAIIEKLNISYDNRNKAFSIGLGIITTHPIPSYQTKFLAR